MRMPPISPEYLRIPQNIIEHFRTFRNLPQQLRNQWECFKMPQKTFKYPSNKRKCLLFFSKLSELHRTHENTSQRLRTSQNVIRTPKILEDPFRRAQNQLERLRKPTKHSRMSENDSNSSVIYQGCSEHMNTWTHENASELHRTSQNVLGYLRTVSNVSEPLRIHDNTSEHTGTSKIASKFSESF